MKRNDPDRQLLGAVLARTMQQSTRIQPDTNEPNGSEPLQPGLLPASGSPRLKTDQLKRNGGVTGDLSHVENQLTSQSNSQSATALDHSHSISPASPNGDLCSRCRVLDVKLKRPFYSSFEMVVRPGLTARLEVIARLGNLPPLLRNAECRLCRLLYKVRPRSADCGAGELSDFTLVRFNGKWAQPWKREPVSKSSSTSQNSTPPRMCFDIFATMDNEVMLGVLSSKSVEDERVETVPYLHDRLFESLSRSGYIRILRDSFLETKYSPGPKPIQHHVEWEFLHSCMDECAFNHPAPCQGNAADNEYKPLKVIDCSTREVVHFPRHANYLALSYVWGSNQSDVSTSAPDMLLDAIPTTISDAMEATLKLKFQYLWVDRYCIPQDQAAVKHKEIRHMDMIYKGAAGTIVACTGTSPWHGLPGCSSHPRSGSERVTLGDQILFSVPPDPRHEIESSNWMTRGWTYQEGLLSRRRIFFADDQVYFECHRRHCFESTAPLLHKYTRKASQKARIFSIGSQSVGTEDFYRIVSEYSGRQLTYESDILNGVWGVLRTFQDFKINHYWGVPCYSKRYIWGFAWDLVTPGRRRSGFPSWSWAGWIGQVKPTLLVNAECAPVRVHGSTHDKRWPSPSTSEDEEENTKGLQAETQQDALHSTLPAPLEEDITLTIATTSRTRPSYFMGAWRYQTYGGGGFAPFLIVNAWIVPASFPTRSVRPTITLRPRSSTSFSQYNSLEWLPTTSDILRRGYEFSSYPYSCILLAARKPLVKPRKSRFGGVLDSNYDVKEGELMNNNWLCLFLVVESKGNYFERVGLARFLFSDIPSIKRLISDLRLEKQEIRLG